MSMQGIATSADIPERVLSGSDFQLLYPAESDKVERKSGASPERLAEAMVATMARIRPGWCRGRPRRSRSRREASVSE